MRGAFLSLVAAALVAITLSLPVWAASSQTPSWSNISSHLTSPSGTPNLSDVHFIGSEGWVTASNFGEVYHTSDGGDTFAVQHTDWPLMAIHMLSASEGYGGSAGSGYAQGNIYRTVNGGADWSLTGTIGRPVNGIHFPPGSAVGYACGNQGKFGRISGSDVTMVIPPPPSGASVALNSVSFPVSADEGWLCGESLLLHFVSGNWVADQVFPTGAYNAIYFVDNLNGWAVGASGAIIHTSDGKNWSAQTNPDLYLWKRDLFGLYFLNQNEGWAVGELGVILHTSNGGNTWNVEADGLTNRILTSVFAVDSNAVYVVGYGGTLLKYSVSSSPVSSYLYLPLLLRSTRP
ncbi:MAG: WD40/YVTN/BNR-like repeat-containing protein [Anaerolineae bacterium]